METKVKAPSKLLEACQTLSDYQFDMLTAAIKLKRFDLAEAITDATDVIIDINSEHTPLVSAIEARNISLVRKLLTKKKLDVNAHGRSERPPILEAVDKPELMALLLERPDINLRVTDSYGNTALIRAVVKNNLETVKFLIGHGGFDVNTVNHDASLFLSPEGLINLVSIGSGGTKLYTIFGHTLDKDIFLESGLTALQTAIVAGYEEIALYLLDNSCCKVNQPYPGGVPMLFVAIVNKLEAVVEKLVGRLPISDINRLYPTLDNRASLTALHVAFRANAFEIFKKLLSSPMINVNAGTVAHNEYFVENTIIGEVYGSYRNCRGKVDYKYLELLMKRPDLNLDIIPFSPIDTRSIPSIIIDDYKIMGDYAPYALLCQYHRQDVPDDHKVDEEDFCADAFC